MKIKEIMSKETETVAHDTPLHEAADKMQKRDCGCVIVVKDDKLVGVITDRDIVMRCVAKAKEASEMTAENVMSPEILYCRETDEVDDVMRNMGKNKIRRLPVLNAEKRLVGIVSFGDLSKHSSQDLCGKVLSDICCAA